MNIGIDLSTTFPSTTAPFIREWGKLADTGPFSSLGIIDRLAYHYEGTVEADIYRALRQRINIFEVVVGPLQPILATIGSSVEAKLLENTPIGTIVDSISAEIDRAKREGVNIEEYAASGVDHQITKHPLPFAAADIDHILRHARCVYEAGYIFTPDEDRSGVYILNGPNYSAQSVTFLPEVFDPYPTPCAVSDDEQPLSCTSDASDNNDYS